MWIECAKVAHKGLLEDSILPPTGPSLFSQSIDSRPSKLLGSCLMSPTSYFCHAAYALLSSRQVSSGLVSFCSRVIGNPVFLRAALSFPSFIQSDSVNLSDDEDQSDDESIDHSNVLDEIFNDRVCERRQFIDYDDDKVLRKSVLQLSQSLLDLSSTMIQPHEWKASPAMSICSGIVWIDRILNLHGRINSIEKISSAINSRPAGRLSTSSDPLIWDNFSSSDHEKGLIVSEISELRRIAEDLFVIVGRQLEAHRSSLSEGTKSGN